MLRRLKIENYRCFELTIVDFEDISILVGKNNAGKSTLIEVLRIIAIIASRCTNLNYKVSPDWLDLNPKYVGVSPSIAQLNISTKNLFHMYGDSPAILTINFSNKSKFEIYVGEEADVFAVIYDQKGNIVSSKSQARRINIREVNILPQISPLQESETVLKYKTVQSGIDTYLSSRHFRNQIKYNYEFFPKFKELAESTWKGLGVRDLNGRTAFEGRPLSLIITDSNFSAEIGWMGHGLQMWLQTMWFLSKSSDNSTVILDEPDVYMHADLQRKLIRLLKGKYKQIIIATHSVEIMSEVEPDNILPVDSSKKRLDYAIDSPVVQQIIENIGSVHNLEIARMFSHKKFLIVEGDNDDTKILGILRDVLYENTNDPIDTIPKTFVEGWGGWQRVIGSNKVFKDSKIDIKTYCILDSDYHVDEDKIKRYQEAQKHDINLHIWQRKEIENYLLIPDAILRIIQDNDKKTQITKQEIEDKIDNIADSFKEEVTDNYATEISQRDRSLSIKTVNSKAREIVSGSWGEKKLCLIPGKKTIKKLSKWTHKNYGVSLNSFKISRNIKKSEINSEVVEVLNKIESNQKFTYPNSE
ncbi:ATP-dependent endonuclease [Flagellimonas lutimaris]|uniref:ATP-dependent endonuclease n=1 Tax=Flagellimonas lutimaris TaxID=475082 RepID=A0A3A1N6M1_9FLAO|nr:AAA family ATPase [Allomuricauda lutimaris]RIV33088.1 ATP-dependent endonuclease [Allomuricauda lutimaris]